MKIEYLNPKARDAYGHALIDAGMAVFKAFILLITVIPITFILKSISDDKNTEVTLVSAIDNMSVGVYSILVGFILLSLMSGYLLKKSGLNHIHEAEELRGKEGKPILIIEPSSSSKDVVEALRKMLPDDKKNAVVLIDLDKNSQ